ncbi:MAG: ferrous iron transport protein A [Deltaproteobacteria bacterium]|nr:ferrous iron transport protein A [Deltaproteobacteria bacterium]
MDMGVVHGEVRVEKVAPARGILEVTIKSYKLSLRKKEAEGISVEC